MTITKTAQRLKETSPVLRDVSLELLEQRIIELRYNPDQPRDPKGSETGGQWASGKSGGIEDWKKKNKYRKTIKIVKDFNSIPEKDNYAYWITKDNEIVYTDSPEHYHTQIVAQYIIENPDKFDEFIVGKARETYAQGNMENPFMEQQGYDKGWIKVRRTRKYAMYSGSPAQDIVGINIPDSLLGIPNVWETKIDRSNKAKTIIEKLDRKGLLPTSYDKIDIFSMDTLLESMTLEDMYALAMKIKLMELNKEEKVS